MHQSKAYKINLNIWCSPWRNSHLLIILMLISYSVINSLVLMELNQDNPNIKLITKKISLERSNQIFANLTKWVPKLILIAKVTNISIWMRIVAWIQNNWSLRDLNNYWQSIYRIYQRNAIPKINNSNKKAGIAQKKLQWVFSVLKKTQMTMQVLIKLRICLQIS